MISFPTARSKTFRLPLRTEPTALDEGRKFLMRIVGLSKTKAVSRTEFPSTRFKSRK